LNVSGLNPFLKVVCMSGQKPSRKGVLKTVLGR
jgi:hypothetical protein